MRKVQGTQFPAGGWGSAPTFLIKNAGRPAPKDAAACVVPPYFAPRKGCLFALYRARPLPPKRPSARALSELPCSLWAVLSDGGAHVLLFFNGKLIYDSYYRRFLPDCQRLSSAMRPERSALSAVFTRSTSPAASAPARSAHPPCGQSSNPKRRSFPSRPCSARRAGRAPARSRWKSESPG